MVKYIRAYIFEILIFVYIFGNAYVLVNQKDYFYPYNMIPVGVIMGYIALFIFNDWLLLFSTRNTFGHQFEGTTHHRESRYESPQ